MVKAEQNSTRRRIPNNNSSNYMEWDIPKRYRAGYMSKYSMRVFEFQEDIKIILNKKHQEEVKLLEKEIMSLTNNIKELQKNYNKQMKTTAFLMSKLEKRKENNNG